MLIWVAIVFSTVIYFGIAVFTGKLGDFEALTRLQYVRVLYGIALLMFLVGWFVVRRVVSGNEHLRMMCALAVFESCAIFGLLTAFLTKDWRLYLGPWALALIGFAREFPRAGTGEGRAPM